MTKPKWHDDLPANPRLYQRHYDGVCDYIYTPSGWMVLEEYKARQAADNRHGRGARSGVEKVTTASPPPVPKEQPKEKTGRKPKEPLKPRLDPYIPGKVYVRPGKQGADLKLMYHGNGRWSRVTGKVAANRVELFAGGEHLKTLNI